MRRRQFTAETQEGAEKKYSSAPSAVELLIALAYMARA
jgi:hypothetical protein